MILAKKSKLEIKLVMDGNRRDRFLPRLSYLGHFTTPSTVLLHFSRLAFSFALQCNSTWMRGNFGLKLQNSPKLPHIDARFHCNANEKG